jgi:hypothetical protein
MNKIVFIAGGPWQKPFVQYLKNKGLYVAIVNPVETPTTALADYHIKADINNLTEINKHIERLNPIFITSDQSDVSTRTVAVLSDKWGLPCNSKQIIDKFTNKQLMNQFAQSLGINAPLTAVAKKVEDVRQFAEAHGFPISIKPADSTNSRGFRRLESHEEITEEVFESTIRFSKAEEVVVQTFIIGDMIMVDGICSGGKHRTISSSRKSVYFKPGIASVVEYSAEVPQLLLDQIVAANDLYVESAGMKFGLTHSEYIVNGDDYWLIEIGGRGGGAGITDKIVPWVSGVGVYDVLYGSLMGDVIDVGSVDVLRRPALLKYYREADVANCTEETVESIMNIPGVADFQLNFIGKQYVSDDSDERHSLGIYLADTHEEISKTEAKVREIVSLQ